MSIPGNSVAVVAQPSTIDVVKLDAEVSVILPASPSIEVVKSDASVAIINTTPVAAVTTIDVAPTVLMHASPTAEVAVTSTTAMVSVTLLAGAGGGAPGPPGPPGPAGGTYTHNQGTPAATWVITHDLGFFPSVNVVNSADEQVEGTVVYTSVDVVTVTFSGAFSGKAYLS